MSQYCAHYTKRVLQNNSTGEKQWYMAPLKEPVNTNYRLVELKNDKDVLVL